MSTYNVQLRQTGEIYTCTNFTCINGETILQGMSRTGMQGIPVGCVNGGCGICKIRVRSGKISSIGPMSRAHVSVEEEQLGVCLACRVAPVENIEIEVLGKIKKALNFGAWGSG